MPEGEFLNRKCPVCLKAIWGYRRTKVYCCAKCRQSAHRKPALEERIKDLYDDAHAAINGLVAVSGRGIDGFRAEQRIKALALELLQNSPEAVQRKIFEDLRDIYGR